MDTLGFPRTKAKQFKRVHGFQTGDMVKVVVPVGKKAGSYIGRVAVRTKGSFNLKAEKGTIQGINYRYCHLLQRADGYNYERGTAFPPYPVHGVGSPCLKHYKVLNLFKVCGGSLAVHNCRSACVQTVMKDVF
jgi:hypothetical protein